MTQEGFSFDLTEENHSISLSPLPVSCPPDTTSVKSQMCHGEEFSTCCFPRSSLPLPRSPAARLCFQDRLTSYRYLLHVGLFVLPSPAPLRPLPPPVGRTDGRGREKSVVSTTTYALNDQTNGDARGRGTDLETAKEFMFPGLT